MAEDLTEGLDFNRPTLTTHVPNPVDITRQQTTQFNIETLKPPVTHLDWWAAVDRQTITGMLMDERRSFDIPPADPAFTINHLEKRLEDAAKNHGVPPEWLHTLSGATSDAHFDLLLARTKAILQDYQIISTDLSTAGHIGILAANLIDPATLFTGGALAVGTIKALAAATRAGGIAMTAPLAIGQGAAGGAVAGLGIEGVRSALGDHVATEEYLIAAGIGAVVGGMFGPVATNHPTAGGLFLRAGQGLIHRGRSAAAKRFGFKPPKPMKGREDIFTKTPKDDYTPFSHGPEPQFDPKQAERFRPPPPVTPEPTPSPSGAAPTALRDALGIGPAEVELPGAGKVRVEVIPEEGLLERLGLQRPVPEAPSVEPTPPHLTAAAVDQQTAAARVARQLEDLEADLKNPRYVERIEAGGNEYKILAHPDADPSGPYLIRKYEKLPLKANRMGKKSTVVAKDFPTIESARAAILKAEGAEFPAVKATPSAPSPEAPAPAARIRHPKRPEVEFDVDAEGNALVYRGTASKGRGSKNRKERINYTTDRNEAASFGDIIQTVKIPPEKIEKITQVHPNNKYLRLPKDLAEPKAEPKPTTGEGVPSWEEVSGFLPVDKNGDLDFERLMKYMDTKFGKKSWNQLTDAEKAQVMQDVLEGKLATGKPLSASVTPPHLLNQGPPPRQQYVSPVVNDFLQEEAASGPAVPMYTGFFGWGLNRLRYDRAGIAVTSPNPFVRFIARHFFNDSVGHPTHGLNTFSGIEETYRIVGRYQQMLYEEWGPARAAYLRARNANFMNSDRIVGEFNHEVGMFISARDPAVLANVDPHVRRAGTRGRQVLKEILEDLKNPGRHEGRVLEPLPFADQIQDNLNYIWRAFDNDAVSAAVEEFGEAGIRQMIRGAILRQNPGMAADLADRIAAGYTRGIIQRGVGLGDEFGMAMAEGNRERLAAILTNDMQLAPADVQYVLDLIRPTQTRPGSAHLQRRVLLDESYVEQGLPARSEPFRDLAFRHLLVNDGEYLINRYLRRMAGRIALARIRIVDPRTGTVLVDGIRTDSEFQTRIIDQIRAVEAENPAFRDRKGFSKAISDVENFQFIYDRIKGVPPEEQMNFWGKFVRRVRQYQTARLLSQVGVAQFGETGYAASIVGWDAAMAHMPGFRHALDHMTRLRRGHGRLTANPFYAEVEAMGVTPEGLHGGLFMRPLDEVSELPFHINRGVNQLQWTGDKTLQVMENGTYKYSGMQFIQHTQQLNMVAAMSQNMAWHVTSPRGQLFAAKPFSTSMMRRLHQFGLDTAPGPHGAPSMAERVLRQMHQFTVGDPSIYWGPLGKLSRLNLHQWTDLEARVAFERSMFRLAKKLIQENDYSTAAFFMNYNVAKIIFMFRQFALAAWNNQFLYNVHMADWRAASMFAWSVAWAGTVRAGQVALLSIGRSDQDKYLEKNLAPSALARAGFQRAGWSSIIPMVWDTVGFGDPVFDARVSGQPTSLVWGNPFQSAADDAIRAKTGIEKAIFGVRSPSQGEARAGARLLPFQNAMGISNLLSYMISGLPERAPR